MAEGDETRLAPFNPTASDSIDAALKLLNLTESDEFLDVGCGDGRVCVQVATTYNIKCRGIERDAKLVLAANERVKEAKLEHLITIEEADALKTSWETPSAVFLYLVPAGMSLVRDRVCKILENGGRVVTNMFSIPDLKPIDETPVGVTKVRLYTSKSL